MKYLLVLIFLLTAQFANAQHHVEMADSMRANGKIYVVVGIIVIILSGMVGYLVMLDRKISKLEKEAGSKTN